MKRGIPRLVWTERDGGAWEATSALPDGMVYRVEPSGRTGFALVQGKRQPRHVFRVVVVFEGRAPVPLYDSSLTVDGAQGLAMMHEWNRAAAFHWEQHEAKRKAMVQRRRLAATDEQESHGGDTQGKHGG